MAPLVDVVQWRGHRPTKPEGAGSTPAVDAPSHQVARRSSVERAPPSEGGRRTFESCRRGRPSPALGAAQGRDPAGSGARLLAGYGVTPVRVRVSPFRRCRGSDPAGSGACLENRYGSHGPWAFESPRFRSRRDRQVVMTPGSHPGSRGSTPRRGTQSMPGGPVARTSGCYPEDERSTRSLAATARWPRASRHAAATATRR